MFWDYQFQSVFRHYNIMVWQNWLISLYSGATFISFIYFLFHLLISRLSFEYQKKQVAFCTAIKKQSHHSLIYSEYQVPDYRSLTIMTPHLQSTHLVVLMQSSCVFTGGFLYFLHLTGWNWSRTCQFILGFTSLVFIMYVLSVFVFLGYLSLSTVGRAVQP